LVESACSFGAAGAHQENAKRLTTNVQRETATRDELRERGGYVLPNCHLVLRVEVALEALKSLFVGLRIHVSKHRLK
jgi:hypothetical protein